MLAPNVRRERKSYKEVFVRNLVITALVRAQVAGREAIRREEGQTLVEYALILTMISIGSIAVLLALSGKINTVFNQIGAAL